MKHRFTMIVMALLVIVGFTLGYAENYIHPVKIQKSESSTMDYKTTPAAYLDWTQDNVNYYLLSGPFLYFFSPRRIGDAFRCCLCLTLFYFGLIGEILTFLKDILFFRYLLFC